jgi:hypothetical protein
MPRTSHSEGESVPFVHPYSETCQNTTLSSNGNPTTMLTGRGHIGPPAKTPFANLRRSPPSTQANEARLRVLGTSTGHRLQRQESVSEAKLEHVLFPKAQRMSGRPLGTGPRGRNRTTKLPRNPLIYHEILLGFVMDCNGLQYLAIVAQTTNSPDFRCDFPAANGPNSGPRGRWFKSSRPDLM